MASQLEKEFCWYVNEQNSIVNSVLVDDWTAELTIIACNGTSSFLVWVED